LRNPSEAKGHIRMKRYVQKVMDIIGSREGPLAILDIPCGDDRLGNLLREQGHRVTGVDLTPTNETTVPADMEKDLPFETNSFDAVICLEGIEHVINPHHLVKELVRVCKEGGRIIISLPNIQNLYSRFTFLCYGSFDQFHLYPNLPTHAKGEAIDRGHVFPLTYMQLRYLFEVHRAMPVLLTGDHYKKKSLFVFLLPFTILGFFLFKLKNLRRRLRSKKAIFQDNRFQKNLLFSRSLILVFEKK